ncbi:MAG: sigma-54-dependent Fis family transcriptional regulator [Acidobacteria bacterium]|nr:sigma-54-dependent Fis family transcriptional regulator [Acidobacteriota bacterium]
MAPERTAVEAIKSGAYDYLAKPFEVDDLRLVVKNALEAAALRRENARLREELKAARGAGDLMGSSDQMRKIYDLISKVAATDVTVLIHGESGTGKELAARAIHDQSALRRNGDFIAMNCAALPSELIESELFGHEKGAFTGAATQRKGKFEMAGGGTIFLDEIGDMSLNTQAKLLRVLEERKVERLGGSQPIPVDVRVISATNRDLASAVATEKFRADLYYRLRVVQIDLPPLRRHKEDIPLLAEHFLGLCSEKYKLKCVAISADAMKRLVAYDWPGNVRELRNAIERSAVLADGTSLCADDLPPEIGDLRPSVPLHAQAGEEVIEIPFNSDYREAKRDFERMYIERVLGESGGNVTRAAERIGMHRQSLQQSSRSWDYPADMSFQTSRRIPATNDGFTRHQKWCRPDLQRLPDFPITSRITGISADSPPPGKFRHRFCVTLRHEFQKTAANLSVDLLPDSAGQGMD